jgi:AcrR family transcriptional regulator
VSEHGDNPDQRLLQGQETRQQILMAAVAIFAEKGYGRTSVRDIAAVAKVGLSNIIYHFGSKENLYLEAIRFFTLGMAQLNSHFAGLFSVDPADKQAVANMLHQSIHSFLHACHGPDSVKSMMGLYLGILVDGNDKALKMLFDCFADVQVALPQFFKSVCPQMGDMQLAFMQQLLWSLLQYPVVSKRLILYDMKLKDDYSEEYLTAAAWHIAMYVCLPLGLPVPQTPTTAS